MNWNVIEKDGFPTLQEKVMFYSQKKNKMWWGRYLGNNSWWSFTYREDVFKPESVTHWLRIEKP